MRFNYDNLTKELGEEKGKEVMNTIENYYGYEGLYECWSDIRFEVVPEFPDRPKTGFMISKDIMGEEVHEYNPSYVSEDSIYDSELNWDHYIIFYVNIGCNEYVRRYINKEESADMNKQFYEDIIDNSFFDIERLLGDAMANKILDALFTWMEPDDLYSKYNVEFKLEENFSAISDPIMPLTRVSGYSIIGTERHDHSETSYCDELDEMFGPLIIDVDILTIHITKESADMMREEFRKMANESFGREIAGRIADLLAAETSDADFEAISNVTKTMSVMPALSHDAPGCWVEAGYSLQQVYANDEFVILCMLKFGEGDDTYDGDCIFHVFSDCSFDYVGHREQLLADSAKIFKQYEAESEAE